MGKAQENAISPTRAEDYPEWYQQVVKAADLAETSAVRGCMVIKPWGYAIWELLQRQLDAEFKKLGVKNAYFPLFIPKSFLEKEAQHVEGFAKECAVVTHSRLEAGPDGKLVPASPLEEPLIVRPTSETIIGDAYSRWVQSYRDLPLLINQWANVVRWEMRTRLFLRTTEFLWQEGHTVHASGEDAETFTMRILRLYAAFAEGVLAIPVIPGRKTAGERFPGAVQTYSIEAMMQDGKALQSGTSHFLGQNFARASGIQFLSMEGKQEIAWTTSWGVSTRLVGGLIMAHSDDDGLILPPRVAPAQVVILPVIPKEEVREKVLAYCRELKVDLEAARFGGDPVRVELDERDLRGGEKVWSWIKKGVPVRLEVGPRDIEQRAVFLARRDLPPREKKSVSRDSLGETLPGLLQEIQDNLFRKAAEFRQARTVEVASRAELYAVFQGDNPGFVLAPYWEDPAVEQQLQDDLKVTVRCIPLETAGEGTCIFSGRAGAPRAVFARSY